MSKNTAKSEHQQKIPTPEPRVRFNGHLLECDKGVGFIQQICVEDRSSCCGLHCPLLQIFHVKVGAPDEHYEVRACGFTIDSRTAPEMRPAEVFIQYIDSYKAHPIIE